MGNITMFEGKDKLNWKYSEEEDVLFISSKEQDHAIGFEIGDGLIVRWDEEKKAVVGLTIIGLNSKISERLKYLDNAEDSFS